MPHPEAGGARRGKHKMKAFPRAGMKAGLVIVASAFLFPLTTQAAKVRVLYSFNGSSDGGFPQGELFRDSAGNLYGTNEEGGSTNCGGSGCGTVFKITRRG